jgi:hypothetical protein
MLYIANLICVIAVTWTVSQWEATLVDIYSAYKHKMATCMKAEQLQLETLCKNCMSSFDSTAQSAAPSWCLFLQLLESRLRSPARRGWAIASPSLAARAAELDFDDDLVWRSQSPEDLALTHSEWCQKFNRWSID